MEDHTVTCHVWNKETTGADCGVTDPKEIRTPGHEDVNCPNCLALNLEPLSGLRVALRDTQWVHTQAALPTIRAVAKMLGFREGAVSKHVRVDDDSLRCMYAQLAVVTLADLIQARAERDEAREDAALTERIARSGESRILPCGHLERYGHTEDGGKTIACYVCELDALKSADTWVSVEEQPHPDHGGQVLVSFYVGASGPFVTTARFDGGRWDWSSPTSNQYRRDTDITHWKPKPTGVTKST